MDNYRWCIVYDKNNPGYNEYFYLYDAPQTQFPELRGMYIRQVTDTAMVDFDIATSTNPYIDGVLVNNKRANAREITFEFGFDLTVEPRDACADIYAFLGTAITGQTPVIISKGNRQITGYVQHIEQLVYDAEPVLQIVFLCGAYWIKNGAMAVYRWDTGSGHYNAKLQNYTIDGGMLPSGWTMTYDIYTHSSSETVTFNITIYEKSNTTAPLAQPYAHPISIQFTATVPIVSSSATVKQCIIKVVCIDGQFNVYQINADTRGTIIEDNYTKIDLLKNVIFNADHFPLAYQYADVQIDSSDLYNNRSDNSIGISIEGRMVR